MKVITTSFEGLFVLETSNFEDARGAFQKLYNYDFFRQNGLSTEFKEFYYSVSKKNVIRGMHFQLPPYEHSKLVYVSKGQILDVVVDLRKESAQYGHYYSIVLNAKDARYLYIPVGFAHGFLSLEDESIVNYAQTSCYSKDCDCGILYNSFGFDWGVNTPVVSGRDMTFLSLQDFKSPF